MLLETLQPIVGNSRNKQPLVIESLKNLALKLGPGAKLPTARELAEALDITGATLTRCLEQLEAKGILRCRQGSGIYVAEGALQRRVAVVFGENIFSASSSPFGSMIIQYCSERAADHNIRFSFFLDTPAFNGIADGVRVPVHQDLVDALKAKELDGLILIARSSVEQEMWLRAQEIPVASTLVRRGAYVPGTNVVLFDYRRLIRCALRKLHIAGCQSVGLLGISSEHQAMFRRAAKDIGMSTRDSWIMNPGNDDSFPAEFHEDYGRKTSEEFLRKNMPAKGRNACLPEGLLITDDMMARGVLSVFTERGLRIGRDIQVCSQSNVGSKVLATWSAGISLVQFNPNDVVVALFDMLEALMNGQSVASPHLVAPHEG